MNYANPHSALGFNADEIVLPSVDGGRGDLGSVAKAVVFQARARLEAWNAAGATGAQVVTASTEVMDRVVRFLYEAAVADFTTRNVQANPKFGVFAQGGYGRGELNPFSDIDLLFLYPWKVTPFGESIAEKILYSLWDTGLQVGHAVRSVPECARLAARDFKVKTALLDARFLCGDAELAASFDKLVETDILRRNPERFFKEKAAESAERHRQYGGSVYLLEPHLKEGEGGLRDLHTALWMARVKFKVRNLREIVQKGVVPESEVDAAFESRDFLWKVRNTLHFLAGSHQDQLTFEYQEQVAATLGYHDADDRRAVERFLQGYYLHAARIHRFESLVIERCMERRNRYGLGRIFSRRIRPGLRITGGEIVVDEPEVLEDPANVVGVFLESQRHGVEISSRARELLVAANLRVEVARESPSVIEPFMEILRGRARICDTLRTMHDVGTLGALVPEFGQLRCMVIRDFYHIYTVDEHTLRGVMELEQLAQGQHRETLPLLTQVMHEVERPEVLYLAMLLHDIGKGHGHGHSDRGARHAEQVARRMGLHEDDVMLVERLVRHHLLMSHVAQHRDLHDDRVIIDFARHVGSIDGLKRLYVLTFADMRAVAPSVWNNWRDLLLRECYIRTLELFEKGEFAEEAREARVERVKERLRERIAAKDGSSRELLERVLRTMPASYFLTTPEQSFPHHIELLREFRTDGGPFVSSIRHFPDREFSEFTVVAADRPGLFSMIAGVLAAHGMNILGAQITTSRDGAALDVFRLTHTEETELDRGRDEERWQRLREGLERVLAGKLSVETLVEKSQRPTVLTRRLLPRIPTSVTFDLQDSEYYSLIEVSAQDQIGLLFAITNSLYRQGCLIHLAKISTVLHHVFDVFYVTDADGRKIEDWRRMQAICEGVRQRLEGKPSE